MIADTLIDALIVALVLFIASIMAAIHRGRQHAPARHAGTPADEEWDDESLAVLKTAILPAYSQTMPRAGTTGTPPWPVQPTRTQGNQPWNSPASTTAPAAPAPAVVTATRNATAPAAPATRARQTTAAAPDVWTPGRIRVCEHPGCPARQSHATAGHNRWLGMVGVLTLVTRPEPAPEPEPGSDIWPTPLPAAVRKHLGAETVTGAMRQIFPDEATADA
jgi:hypothetical protein